VPWEKGWALGKLGKMQNLAVFGRLDETTYAGRWGGVEDVFRYKDGGFCNHAKCSVSRKPWALMTSQISPRLEAQGVLM